MSACELQTGSCLLAKEEKPEKNSLWWKIDSWILQGNGSSQASSKNI